MLVLLIGGLVGAVAGSAATALADRYDQLRSFMLGRSVCPHCRRQLAWFELVPVVSYLALRGRCRTCRAPIGRSVLLIELAAAGFGAWFTLVTPNEWSWLWFFGLLTVLAALTLVDLAAQELPDQLLALAVVPTLALAVTLPDLALTPQAMVVGALVTGGSVGALYALTRGRGIGLGDVKLAALMGLGLGLGQGLTALFVAFTAGGLVATGLLVTGRATRKDRIAFGPFLIGAYLVTLLLGSRILSWYSY